MNGGVLRLLACFLYFPAVKTRGHCSLPHLNHDTRKGNSEITVDFRARSYISRRSMLWEPQTTTPAPTTGKQLQHYLGFANYFREHVPLMSRITAPLDRLRKETDLRPHW